MSIKKSLIITTDLTGKRIKLIKLDEFKPKIRNVPAHRITVIYTENGDLVTELANGNFEVAMSGVILWPLNQ